MKERDFKINKINTSIRGIALSLETSSTVFSPHGIDKGTLAMLSVAEITPDDKVLDLGCGYGIVGIYAAKIIDNAIINCLPSDINPSTVDPKLTGYGEKNVVMSDIDDECVYLSKKNAETNNVGGIKTILSDGFKDIHENDFTLILLNPPYHVDFAVPKHLIEKSFNRLQVGGKMYMVTKRKQWYKNKLTAIFGGVKVYEIDGYYVFCAQKRSASYANKKPRQKADK